MVAIPNKITTLDLIDSVKTEGYPRTYLGMSSIGDACERKLWYGLHWVRKGTTSARVNRIFNDGHNAEEGIVKDLESVGVTVHGRQIELVGFAGHAKGHIDGLADGLVEAPKTTHLLEFKTMNDDNFKKLKKLGVKLSKPGYYAQMQRYMHEGGWTRTLFIAKNKNDSSYHFERIHYDKEYALELVKKEQDIITSDVPPTKKFSNTWYECNYCGYNGICHKGEEPLKNCRTCDNCDMENGGVWVCTIDNSSLTKEQQESGCHMYKKGWGL